MAHFAKIDNNNIVIDVNGVNNEIINNLPFPDSEPIGIAFLTEWSNGYSNWKQTSYNGNFRKNYAGIGYTYDQGRDAFIAPKPFNSWLLDEDKAKWKAPVDKPTDDKKYKWDETSLNWIEVILQG
jgi:hypothetical protein